MVFCVREIEALRLLGWCQYIRPAQLLRVVSETELSNLLTMKPIKYHSKSEALILTTEGCRLLTGTIWLPDTPRTYHADAVVRRLRLASLLLTAYQSGINVYATQPDELAEGKDIVDRDKRLSVLKSKQAGGDGAVNATISLSELYAMQQEVAAIPVPDAINELADDVLCELRGNGIEVSDRKYLNYYPLVQAKAWLEGHDKVESQDLLILKCYLWQVPSDRPAVENMLTRLCINPLQDKMSSILVMAMEAQEDFNTVVADGSNPKTGSKALLKLRGELLQLYKRQQELCTAAQSDSEKDMVNKLLNDLAAISMAAHNAVNFTYIPLEQMAALQ